MKMNTENKKQIAIKAEILFGMSKFGMKSWKDIDLTDVKSIKRYLKNLYKDHSPKQLTVNIAEHINSWIVYAEDGESYKTVRIFQKTDEIMEKISEYYNTEGDDNYYDYSPTGLWFRDYARFYTKGNRVFMIQ